MAVIDIKPKDVISVLNLDILFNRNQVKKHPKPKKPQDEKKK